MNKSKEFDLCLELASRIVSSYRNNSIGDPQNSLVYVAVGATVVGGVSQYASASKNASASEDAIASQTGLVTDSAALSTQTTEDQFAANSDLLEKYIAYLEEAAAKYEEQAAIVTAEEEGYVRSGYQDVTNISDSIYANINNIIAGIPSIQGLMSQAESLSSSDFAYRTAQARENLSFILGGTEGQLREAQSLNTSLAALDPNTFTGKMGDILKSSTLGLKALTVGEPTGSFANLSAQNLYNFSNQGLSNALAIGDFFSQNGTVDPVSPLQTAFDLQNTYLNSAQLYIGNEQSHGANLINATNNFTSGMLNIGSQKLGIATEQLNQANSIAELGLGTGLSINDQYYNNLLGINDSLTANLVNLSNAGLTAETTSNTAQAQAISSIGSGLLGAASIGNNQTALAQQQSLYSTLAGKYGISTVGTSSTAIK